MFAWEKKTKSSAKRIRTCNISKISLPTTKDVFSVNNNERSVMIHIRVLEEEKDKTN